MQGRHTRGAGYIGEMQKYNAVVLLKWAVLRFTPEQVDSGEALDVIEEFIKIRERII